MYCRTNRLPVAALGVALLLLAGCDPLVDSGTLADRVDFPADVPTILPDLPTVEVGTEGDADLAVELPRVEETPGDGECLGTPCGESCCLPGEVCVEGSCCKPACAGKVCGDDGCGGSCGECEGFQEACVDGQCVCQPDCAGKACGDDGCGGSCGSCGGDCTLVPPWGEAQRITALAVGQGGHPGQALDIDANPTTCTPPTNCEGGLNNQLSGTLTLLANAVDVDDELSAALAEGDLNVLLEWRGYAGDDQPFELRVHPGIATEIMEKCNGKSQTCAYLIAEETLDPGKCEPFVTFPDAMVANGRLAAGGPDALFVFRLPLSSSATLLLTARMARIEGEITQDAEGTFISDGLIGGAIRKQEFIDAVDLIPPEAELPVTPETIKALLELFIVNDVDTDGDGALDAASIGVTFEARPAVITGFAGGDNLVCSPEGQCVPVK